MKYVFVEDGVPQIGTLAVLGKSLKLPNGDVVLNSDKLSQGSLKALGYYQFVMTSPVLEPYEFKTDPVFVVVDSVVEAQFTIRTTSLSDYKAKVSKEINKLAKYFLDTNSGDRSVLELGRWATLKQEVKEYSDSGLVGEELQMTIDTSEYSADDMVMYVASRKETELAIYSRRHDLNHAVAVGLDHAEVAALSIGTGWPGQEARPEGV